MSGSNKIIFNDGKLKPISEGSIDKGGRNPSGQFDRRPPPPAALKPSSSNQAANKEKK